MSSPTAPLLARVGQDGGHNRGGGREVPLLVPEGERVLDRLAGPLAREEVGSLRRRREAHEERRADRDGLEPPRGLVRPGRERADEEELRDPRPAELGELVRGGRPRREEYERVGLGERSRPERRDRAGARAGE